MSWPLQDRGRDPTPIVHVTGWAPRPAWMGVKRKSQLHWGLSRLHRRGLVRGFISIPFPSLARLSAVDWPSWKGERHERFSDVSSVETFYVPINLVSTSVWILSSWVQLSKSTSAWGRSLELLD